MIDLFIKINEKEINYKPSARHNNYTYRSKDDSPWNLYQVVYLFQFNYSFHFNLIDFAIDIEYGKHFESNSIIFGKH